MSAQDAAKVVGEAELLSYAQGHVHQDVVYEAARRAMMKDVTGGFYDEHLFRETMRATFGPSANIWRHAMTDLIERAKSRGVV